MDGATLESLLKCCVVTRPYFRGVFPADGITPPTRFPASMIVNLDKSNKPGSHWVAIYSRSKDEADYFDSYGEAPPAGGIQAYLRTFPKVKTSSFVIQSIISDVCGHYCLYFLFMRSQGTSYDKLLAELAKHKSMDNYVRDFTHELCQ